MTPRSRGYLLVVLTSGAFALTLYLTTHKPSRPLPEVPDPAPPPPPERVTAPAHDPALCEKLRAEYVVAIEDMRGCREDADCTAQEVPPLHASLEDGCFRVVRTGAPSAQLDAIARRWLGASCTDRLGACERRPAVACRPLAVTGEKMCVELPPAGVPEGWRRERVSGVVKVFLPPDMKRADNMLEHRYALFYRGDGRTLVLEFGGDSTLTPDARASDFPGEKLLAARRVKSSGRETTLYEYERREPSKRPSWSAIAALHDAADPLYQRNAILNFSLSCEARPRCDVAPAILRSLELLSEGFGSPVPAASTPR